MTLDSKCQRRRMKIGYKMSCSQRRNICINNCGMLTSPEKELLEELYYKNRDSLRSYHHEKDVNDEPSLPSCMAFLVPKPQSV
ncbi:hypothetical protein TNCV_806091 [Trichonephila clavipes]|nr:hypothetical protein TNCV_806091 [Trichonephila clavipes]